MLMLMLMLVRQGGKANLCTPGSLLQGAWAVHTRPVGQAADG